MVLNRQHLFGRVREGHTRLPELDRGHAPQRRVEPGVVAPVGAVRQLGLQLARRAEGLAKLQSSRLLQDFPQSWFYRIVGGRAEPNRAPSPHAKQLRYG